MKYFNRVFSLIKLKYLLLKMTRNPLYFSKLFVHLRIQFVTPDCDWFLVSNCYLCFLEYESLFLLLVPTCKYRICRLKKDDCTVVQRSLPFCEQRQLHSVHRSAATCRCSWLITLSNYTTVSCSKLINNRSREGGGGVPSLRDGARLSLPPVSNISSAVYHTKRSDIGSEYIETSSWFFLNTLVWRVRNEKMQKCFPLRQSVRRQLKNRPLSEFSWKFVLESLN